ncbi:hypothetical protein SAMN05444483_12232 [Salegentibacter echinorum]|uniref:DUF2281 domain-containing protein n=1 Tax=Salegentibacter echinorum TaxID=1073325 RepID=A0A1M5LVE0_SALEC|nr:hypothetical protein [Salegentibacter echinorum]SHG69092.1 hypothetical protein SAMN05444483_12232 [Salegentibacter echinorum]
MKKQAILEKTFTNLAKLPKWRLREVSDYVEFLIQKNENKELQEELQEYAGKSETFSFLEEEEDLYNDEDLIEKY